MAKTNKNISKMKISNIIYYDNNRLYYTLILT